MKIFLDTNILIDNFDSARCGARASARVIRLCDREDNRAIISALSIPNILYVLRKTVYSHEQQERIVRILCSACNVVSLERGDLLLATDEDFDDYEDGLQILAAEKAGADCIITNDKTGFLGARIKVLMPEEFLMQESFRAGDGK